MTELVTRMLIAHARSGTLAPKATAMMPEKIGAQHRARKAVL